MRLIARSLRAQPWQHGAAITGGVIFALAAVGLTRVLAWITDDVITPALDGDGISGNLVWGTVALILTTGVIRGVGGIVRRYYLAVAEYGTQHLWRGQLFDKYMRLPLAFHRSRPTGELLAHVDNDLMVSTFMLKPLAYAVATVVLLVASLVSLLVIHPLMALVAVVLFPILALMNHYYTNRVETPAGLAQQAVGNVSSIAHESFDGVLVVKTLGREDAEVARLEKAAEELRDQRIVVGNLRANFEPAIDALPNLGIVALLGVGVWLVDGGSMSVGDLVGAMALFSILALPMRIVGYMLEEMPRSVVSLARIDRILDIADPEQVGADSLASLPSGPLSVEFRNVVAGYPDQDVLRDVSFQVNPGESVAIVGATGCGKSTMAHALLGLGPIEGGQILLGGVPISAIDPDELHRDVALVFQETFLFADTIAENIDLERGVGAERIEHVAQVANAHEFIKRLDDSYGTVVGERGVTLSGGQRQRVALARALAGRPRVLFLDDATSAVDPSVEADILDNLRMGLDLTLMVVAHRLSTIKLADRVIFVVDGAVAGVGSHNELLALPEYETLVRAYEDDAA